MVRCPIECVIEEEETPAYLPETGKDKTNTSLLLAAGVVFLSILAFQLLRVHYQESL
jgi:LPXTG-motif cell wall-anchored protein